MIVFQNLFSVWAVSSIRLSVIPLLPCCTRAQAQLLLEHSENYCMLLQCLL